MAMAALGYGGPWLWRATIRMSVCVSVSMMGLDRRNQL